MVPLGVDASGRMREPSRPDVVAWYVFGSRPGEGGNIILAGHVDSKAGVAVFWYIRYLRPGDAITIQTDDGAEHQYEVTDTTTYPAYQAPVSEIVGPASEEVVTIITCEGTFRNGDYSHRRVVRAKRV
jgi:LPXTG-site transpeptidase (sortase) family protein